MVPGKGDLSASINVIVSPLFFFFFFFFFLWKVLPALV